MTSIVDNFLNIPLSAQKLILKEFSNLLNKSEEILEKDIWICWVLDKLFSLPDGPKMAFKGGTSLSKVYNAIFRFSEDIDITFDYRNFLTKDPFQTGISNTQIKKIGDQLKESLKNYVHQKLTPYFHSCFEKEFGKKVDLRVSDNGELFEIHYTSALDSRDLYIKPYILLEFGARNVCEPSGTHQIKPILTDSITSLHFPHANVCVLAPERTFWEKVTLIHAACNRKELKKNSECLSRHWYDLSMLFRSNIGSSAIQNKSLLKDVIKHKRIFYHSSFAGYDQCLEGKFNLIPQGEHLKSLTDDYLSMISTGMFYEQPKPFEEILGDLKQLELSILNT